MFKLPLMRQTVFDFDVFPSTWRPCAAEGLLRPGRGVPLKPKTPRLKLNSDSVPTLHVFFSLRNRGRLLIGGHGSLHRQLD